MQQSKTFIVDDAADLVKPNPKVERTTLILRDIDDSVTQPEIEAIFSSAEHKPQKVVKGPEDTWFVTFNSESACTDMALWALSQTFKGKQLKCRVKMEVARSYQATNNTAPSNPPKNPYASNNPYLYNGFNNLPFQPVPLPKREDKHRSRSSRGIAKS
jgi:hypothetical protein